MTAGLAMMAMVTAIVAMTMVARQLVASGHFARSRQPTCQIDKLVTIEGDDTMRGEGRYHIITNSGA